MAQSNMQVGSDSRTENVCSLMRLIFPLLRMWVFYNKQLNTELRKIFIYYRNSRTNEAECFSFSVLYTMGIFIFMEQLIDLPNVQVLLNVTASLDYTAVFCPMH